MYGYAQEHRTIYLWLRLWHPHTKDISLHGTPPPCDKLVDIVTSMWNKSMGYVDTLREVLKSKREIRGTHSGPGSLLWYKILDLIL